jgi:hypothetical protein
MPLALEMFVKASKGIANACVYAYRHFIKKNPPSNPLARAPVTVVLL